MSSIPPDPSEKPRGRPRTLVGTAAAVPVSVRLPTRLHDRLAVESLRRHVSLAHVLRERLARDLPPA